MASEGQQQYPLPPPGEDLPPPLEDALPTHGPLQEYSWWMVLYGGTRRQFDGNVATGGLHQYQ